MFSETFVLALDIGTSSVRAAIYDAAGERVPDSFVKNEREVHFTEQGGAELDAGAALRQVEAAIDEVLHLVPNAAAKIEYAAISSFWHSLIGVDADGNAVTPVLTWADTRAKDHIQAMRARLDETALHDRTGCRFHPSYWPAKLLWFRQEQPEIFEKAEGWMAFSDYLALKFFGTAITSVSMASGSGVFDIRKCEWDAEFLNFLQIAPEKLPRLAADDDSFALNDSYADRWRSLRKVKWFPAIGDGAANNVGAGCVTSGRAALMIGTSGAMRILSAGAVPERIPAGLFCYRLDRKRFLIGGALSDGGGLYAWLKDVLRLGGDESIEEEIARSEPDAHGLTFLPFLAGERSTGYNENAAGAILGLTAHTTPLEITQAALEAVAYRFAAIFEQLCGVFEIKEVVASGGALRESPVWTQIIADVLGRELRLPEAREASSQGAVRLALEIAGIKLPAHKKINYCVITPDKKKNKIYAKARERHKKSYNMLIG